MEGELFLHSKGLLLVAVAIFSCYTSTRILLACEDSFLENGKRKYLISSEDAINVESTSNSLWFVKKKLMKF